MLEKCYKKITKISRKMLGNIEYYIVKNDSKYTQDMVDCINTIHIDNKWERNAYIYDTVCEHLDKQFQKCNFCEFKDTKCVANRNGNISFNEFGCCYSFEPASFFSLDIVKNEKSM